MGLSCTCDYDYDADWYWTTTNDFKTFNAKRRKRCCSCNELIDIGSECIELERFRHPITEVEIKIHNGDDSAEVEIASWFLCEECGEHYLNLDALGYCYNIGDNIMENLIEYQIMTGFCQSHKEAV